jgi:thymidylate synthase
MQTIIAETIADGHEKVIKLIMGTTDFNDVLTEDKEQTFEYPEPVNIHITHPARAPFLSPALMFGEKSMEIYKDEILIPRPLIDKPGKPDFSYLYSILVWDYPNDFSGIDPNTHRPKWLYGDGWGHGRDQINYVVEKLTSNSTSRRAVVSLFEPNGHELMNEPPCLNHIQYLVRNGYLNCHALFRSNDMLSAWGCNAYALMRLQEAVLIRLLSHNPDLKIGWLETTSISAHIYWKRDQHELDQFRKRWC